MKLSEEETDRDMTDRTVNASSGGHVRIGLLLAATILLLQLPLFSLSDGRQSARDQSAEPDKFYRQIRRTHRRSDRLNPQRQGHRQNN